MERNFITRASPCKLLPTNRTDDIMSSKDNPSKETSLTEISSSPKMIFPVFSAGRRPPVRGCFLKDPATAAIPDA